jgi:hypothetical protein
MAEKSAVSTRTSFSAVLHMIVRVIEQTLKRHAGEITPAARIGAVSFIHRFGSALNTNVHFHLCVIETVFEPGPDWAVQVHGLDLPDAALVQAQRAIRRRVLSWFTRRGWLDEDDRKDMLGWAGGGGFSLDGSVRIEAEDRAGLERLPRYCAQPPFALERLEPFGDDRLIYTSAQASARRAERARPHSARADRQARRPHPTPRRHRHRYHGVLAPNSPLRAAVTELDPKPVLCNPCGAEMRLVAFITKREPIDRILKAMGEPTRPPRVAPAGGPPQPTDPGADPLPLWDELAQPTAEFQFDHRITW